MATAVRESLAKAQRSAVHLEMRDSYMRDDPEFIRWQEGHRYDPVWFASVAVLDEGGYEVVRRDTTRREHDVTVETSTDRIAGDLTKWLAARAS